MRSCSSLSAPVISISEVWSYVVVRNLTQTFTDILPIPPLKWSSFTDPAGMEGWANLGGWLHSEIKVRRRELNPDTVTHLSTNRAWRRLTSLIDSLPELQVKYIKSFALHLRLRVLEVESSFLHRITRYYPWIGFFIAVYSESYFSPFLFYSTRSHEYSSDTDWRIDWQTPIYPLSHIVACVD